MADGNNALVLEITRQDNVLKMSVFQQSELALTLRHYSQRSVSFSEIDRLCRENISAETGQLFWNQLLTSPVKDRLKNSANKDLILSIDEELIHIPWESLYDGNDFLCLKFNLGRLIRTKGDRAALNYRALTSAPKMLILANPANDLKSAYLEGAYIKNQFEKRRRQISIDFKSTHIDSFYVKKNLRDYDIVHFAGHAEFDAQNPENTGWVLADGKLNAQDIQALGEALSLPSLVFSNACYSARVKAGLTEADCQKKTYSLASAFLFSGVRHYIGAIRRIEDELSLIFAKEFYAQLIRAKPVGESLRLARLKLIKERGINSISWASYVLYGDPGFTLFKPKLKPPFAKIKNNIFTRKKHVIRFFQVIAVILISLYIYTLLLSINPSAYISFLKSKQLFLSGKNQEVILRAGNIIKKDPLFLAAYPLLADTYQRLGDKENALKYYFDYALYSQKKNDKKSLAQSYIGIGWLYQNSAEYAKALDFYNKALSLSQEAQDKSGEAVALRKLALWFMDKEDNDKALELLMKSSEINRERQYLPGHRYNLACDYFDIGLLFTDKNDFKTAREFYTKSRQLFEKLKLKNELSDYYFNLGEISLFEKDYQKALDFYLKGLEIDKTEGNKPGIAGDYNMLGELYAAMDNFSESEKFFIQAVSASKEIDAQPELAAAYYNLGLLNKQKGRRNKAKENFRFAQEIYSRIDPPSYQKIKQEISELDNPL